MSSNQFPSHITSILWVCCFSIAILLGAESCTSTHDSQPPSTDSLGEIPIPTGVFQNGSGEQIYLGPPKRQAVNTRFINQKGELWDTVMTLDSTTIRIRKDATWSLTLRHGMTAIEIVDDTLFVREFSNLLYLDQFIHMENLYDHGFVRVSE